MFDRIFDFIESVWEWLLPFVVIDIYERGVVLRLGKPNRDVEPGLRWVWPLGIEQIKYETVVRQTAYLDVQSLTSKDAKPVTIAGIVIFEIKDIRKFLCEIDEGETDVMNMVYGVISDCVEATLWNDIRTPEFNRSVLEQSRKIVNKYCGVKIFDIKWSDKATARSIRLWND